MSLNVSYDVELIIYRLIHEDYTQKLNSEYKNCILSTNGSITFINKLGCEFMFNYRRIRNYYPMIYNINKSINVAGIPKRYIYSSGLNNSNGYNDRN